jgi:perosamine synthetase
MIVTNEANLADRMRVFRNHGITTDHRQRTECGSWFYEMVDLGFNYRISDFQCALGSSQLGKLPAWLEGRRRIAAQYARRFGDEERITALGVRNGVAHAWHLYVVRLGTGGNPVNRMRVFQCMREAGIGVNVHYIPVHLHPYYRQTLGTSAGLCPEAERAYEQILSLPMYPQMLQTDVDYVSTTLIQSLTEL